MANPKITEVTDHIDFTGTVGAVQSVNIVARVEGYLEGIYFQDGSYVKKGTLLFKIQQEQYIEDRETLPGSARLLVGGIRPSSWR